MNNTTEFCVFNLPVVYVYGSFSFDLDKIDIVLFNNNSTSGSKWLPNSSNLPEGLGAIGWNCL